MLGARPLNIPIGTGMHAGVGAEVNVENGVEEEGEADHHCHVDRRDFVGVRARATGHCRAVFHVLFLATFLRIHIRVVVRIHARVRGHENPVVHGLCTSQGLDVGGYELLTWTLTSEV